MIPTHHGVTVHVGRLPAASVVARELAYTAVVLATGTARRPRRRRPPCGGSAKEGMRSVTGPEHYRKAEELLRMAEAAPGQISGYVAACAHVHAQLAEVAQNAELFGGLGDDEESGLSAAWREAIGL